MKRALLLLALALTACPRAPRPVVFAQIDKERATPAVNAAREGSPALFAKAEAMRKKAEDAFAAGDTATAELLGQGALAAYQHAAATARLTAATVRHSAEAARLAKAQEQLAADEASRLEVDRDVDRL